MILEAMEINGKGRLYSIDLPIIKKERKLIPYVENYKIKLEDTTFVTEQTPTGYLIPEYLRYRWKLILGDSLVEIPKLLKNFTQHERYEAIVFIFTT